MKIETFDDIPLFLTPKELADITHEHVVTVTTGIREGRIPADKVNGRWRICRDIVFPNTRRALAGQAAAESGNDAGTAKGGAKTAGRKVNVRHVANPAESYWETAAKAGR